MNKNKIDVQQFENLFLQDTSWIDVRAPIEFNEGSIPHAVNLPILNDAERKEVGTAYKAQGKDVAIQLGHKLVSENVKQERVEQWAQFKQNHPNAVMYCFRGGLRSQIAQQWLKELGVDCSIVQGGYKALRKYLMEAIENLVPQMSFLVIAGLTGSGKTYYLYSSRKKFIDLEKLAHHRGSAFGAYTTPQPTQINFENHLAVELLKLFQRVKSSNESILIESESRMIGRLVVPQVLFQKIKQSPRQVLEVSFEQRIENIFKDYILDSPIGLHQDVEYFNHYRECLQTISKKLGDARSREILNDLEYSRNEFINHRKLDSNRTWIEKLLKWYYDPLYQGIY